MNLFYGGDAPKKSHSKSFCWVSTKFVRESGPWYTTTIKTPDDVANVLNEHLDIENADREMFIALYLDRKNQISYAQVVSTGGLSSSLVHPREIFRAAVLTNTASIIVAHNHPSGDPTPSKEDIETTRNLIEAGKIMGINILDHIIVGCNGHVSLKDRGLI